VVGLELDIFTLLLQKSIIITSYNDLKALGLPYKYN
jgi:hypothetical protein